MRSTRPAAALLAAGTVLALAVGTAAPATAKPKNDGDAGATPFAFRAVSYGTRVRGGQLPVSSGTTSYQAIACTNRVGTAKENQVATVELPGLGRLDGVKATTGTSGSGEDVATYSTHEIAALGLDVPGVLGLQVRGISASSTASHDAGGYHAATDVKVARITLTAAGQPALDLPIPTPQSPVEVPGLLSISIGKTKRLTSPAGAVAKAEGLVIKVLPTGTKVQVAHTATKLNRGIKRGLFFGKANATHIKALGDLVRSGPQPLQVMPCQGTKGETRGKDLATLSVPGVFEVGGASTQVNGSNLNARASGYTAASVARANVLNGVLVLDAIKARAHVARTKRTVKADSNGTTIGSATLNGQPVDLGTLDGLEVPGVLRVDTDVVTRSGAGIDVVGVRITLLNGTGAVIDLAHASLEIAGAGLKK